MLRRSLYSWCTYSKGEIAAVLSNTFANSAWEEMLQSGSSFQTNDITKAQILLSLIQTFSCLSENLVIFIIFQLKRSSSMQIAKQQREALRTQAKEESASTYVFQHMWDSVCSSDKKQCTCTL